MTGRSFFKIVKPWEPELIGVKDGLSQVEIIKKNFKDKKNYDKYENYFVVHDEQPYINYICFPPFDFELEYVKNKKSAFLTDMLYFAPSVKYRFLVNSKVLNMITDLNIPPYKNYSVTLHFNDVINNQYSFFYCPAFGLQYVDFKKSIFSTGAKDIGFKKIKLNSVDDYMKIDEPINRDRVVLKNFDSNLDFFNLMIIPEPIISEKLRDRLTEESVTGIKIVELPEDQFQILA